MKQSALRLDAYHAAGGASRADLFGEEVYLEDAELLNRLAAAKLDAVPRELESEGWGWVEISPDRDWDMIQRWGRIHPRPVEVPQTLHDQETALEDPKRVRPGHPPRYGRRIMTAAWSNGSGSRPAAAPAS